MGRLPEAGSHTFGVALVQAWPAGTPTMGPDGVVAQIVRSPLHAHRLTAETNGLGEPCCQELFRRMLERPKAAGGGPPPRGGVVLGPWDLNEFLRGRGRFGKARSASSPEFRTELARHTTSAGSKAATFGALRLLIESQRLLIPAGAGDLYRELLMLGVELTASGNERIEAQVGHDDLADGLALALGPYRAHSGEWRTVLGDLADGGQELPRPRALLRGDGEWVETSARVRVPRRPLWQSIASGEVTATAAEAERWAEQEAARERLERIQAAVRAASANFDNDNPEEVAA